MPKRTLIEIISPFPDPIVKKKGRPLRDTLRTGRRD
jgi:hypothetical protein